MRTVRFPRDRALVERGSSLRRNPPWALELSNGERCIFTSGATFTVAGKRGNYFCPHGGRDRFGNQAEAWVVGTPNRSLALWRALYAESREAQSFKEVTIYVAWY
ncbi:MAG: hypothetical protein AABM30_09370 [Actinomycetota bacterium]